MEGIGGLFEGLTAGLAQHPGVILLLTWVVSFAEGVPLLGLLVPASALMVALGSLIGLGYITTTPMLLVAALGALGGDLFGFWLGRRYGSRLLEHPQMKRYRPLLKRSEEVLTRYGAMGLFVGRFIPPLRPLVPMLVGTGGKLSFAVGLPVMMLAGAVWAPLYLLPGLLVGHGGALLGHLHGGKLREASGMFVSALSEQAVSAVATLMVLGVAVYFVAKWLLGKSR